LTSVLDFAFQRWKERCRTSWDEVTLEERYP